MSKTTPELITTAIQERDRQKLASALDKVRAAATNTTPSWLNPHQAARESANQLYTGLHTLNLNSTGTLVTDSNNIPELVIWGSPLPFPSHEGLVAYNIEYLGADSNTVPRRLELIGVTNNNWEIVPPIDNQDLARYRRFRFLSRLGLPSRMFYNQPNRGEQVTRDDINETHFLPHASARLRIIVDHKAGKLWDGEWAYYYTSAEGAEPGENIMNLKQSHERFEELGLAHVTLLDRLEIALNQVRTPISAYRGLFAYPPNRKAS